MNETNFGISYRIFEVFHAQKVRATGAFPIKLVLRHLTSVRSERRSLKWFEESAAMVSTMVSAASGRWIGGLRLT